MRRALTIVLMAAVVALQLGSRWIVYAAWKANQAYIEAEMCENRDAPEMECHGQCHLKKQLRKTEEQEGKTQKMPIPEFAPAPMPEPVRLAAVRLVKGGLAERRAFPPFEAGVPMEYAGRLWQPPGVEVVLT